ncbi:hypothetical protein HE1_00767 [Holospora elegans E1]|uniref:Uncharacterized protein n=2 Tax=Holospora TaxID=44747 RepID=A0A023DZE5_9PROT|nr:hypothetical protein HE1_00767 [Holospora elegans E1]
MKVVLLDTPKTHSCSDKGKRCYGSHDWGRTNALGALVDQAIIEISLIFCSVNTDFFASWVQQILLPNIPKESGSVMNNAAFQKGKL